MSVCVFSNIIVAMILGGLFDDENADTPTDQPVRSLRCELHTGEQQIEHIQAQACAPCERRLQ